MAMKKRTGWLLVAIATLLIGPLVGFCLWPGDHGRIQGAWVGDDDARAQFTGDLLVFAGGPEAVAPRRFYFRIDERATPKRIVICDASDPRIRAPVVFLGMAFGTPRAQTPEQESRGIYDIKDGRLRICLARPGEDYPTGFDLDQRNIVLELRRE